jgi:precorrin-6x reductase
MTGILHLVSVGPGDAALIAPAAVAALEQSEVIVGYELYVRQVEAWTAGKEILSPPLTREKERALLAIERARQGQTVALISSGDIGVYAMATLAFEEMREDDVFEVKVIPGITAANACASLVGAPLSHDFATLSLSDLLCPWEWIETRARHIAEADLAAVLYNVQSQGRQEGVYCILDIMLRHKQPETVCAVVRNAYRPDQAVKILSLADLRSEKFDMLTSVIIGNRFTRRKRSWIYTPRGYGQWTDAKEQTNLPALPEGAVWVFSGTSDGNQLAAKLAEQGRPVVVSTATDYGGEVAQANIAGAHVLAGRRGIEARRQDLGRSKARAIVDATHPHATEISWQLMALSQETGVPYIRYERPSPWESEETLGANVILCDSMEEAAEQAVKQGRRIFLATGYKALPIFLAHQEAARREWFVRVTPNPQVIQQAVDLGIPYSHICAMQGPFDPALNESLWRNWNIDCVISKESGDAGGFRSKLAAAAAMGLALIVVRRPKMSYPRQASDFDGILHFMESLA